MTKQKGNLRGFIDPMLLGFILSVFGSTAVLMFEAAPEEGPPEALAQVCDKAHSTWTEMDDALQCH